MPCSRKASLKDSSSLDLVVHTWASALGGRVKVIFSSRPDWATPEPTTISDDDDDDDIENCVV